MLLIKKISYASKFAQLQIEPKQIVWFQESKIHDSSILNFNQAKIWIAILRSVCWTTLLDKGCREKKF